MARESRRRRPRRALAELLGNARDVGRRHRRSTRRGRGRGQGVRIEAVIVVARPGVGELAALVGRRGDDQSQRVPQVEAVRDEVAGQPVEQPGCVAGLVSRGRRPARPGRGRTWTRQRRLTQARAKYGLSGAVSQSASGCASRRPAIEEPLAGNSRHGGSPVAGWITSPRGSQPDHAARGRAGRRSRPGRDSRPGSSGRAGGCGSWRSGAGRPAATRRRARPAPRASPALR